MIRLKSFDLKSRVIQSPMAGCTDLAFRLIAREHGMQFAFLEMISAHALVRQNVKTQYLLKSTEEDSPLGAQLVGCEPEIMGEAAGMIENLGFDWLDINFGCPVPKVVSPGGGSALLREPAKAQKIFERMRQAVKKIPLTVKMRLGFSDASGKEAEKIAQIAEAEGLDAITVHGRTRDQGYSGKADWEAIGRIKKAVRIPVFGNGDVNSAEDAKKMIEITGCDGVMIGRGSLGNPWIYRSIDAAFSGDKAPEHPSLEEVKKVVLKHMALVVETDGLRVGLLKTRRIACWYFKALPGVSEFRDKINHAQSVEEAERLIAAFGSHPTGH